MLTADLIGLPGLVWGVTTRTILIFTFITSCNKHTYSSLLKLSYCVVLQVVPMWDSFPVSLYCCAMYDCAMTIKLSYLSFFLLFGGGGRSSFGGLICDPNIGLTSLTSNSANFLNNSLVFHVVNLFLNFSFALILRFFFLIFQQQVCFLLFNLLYAFTWFLSPANHDILGSEALLPKPDGVLPVVRPRLSQTVSCCELPASKKNSGKCPDLLLPTF